MRWSGVNVGHLPPGGYVGASGAGRRDTARPRRHPAHRRHCIGRKGRPARPIAPGIHQTGASPGRPGYAAPVSRGPGAHTTFRPAWARHGLAAISSYRGGPAPSDVPLSARVRRRGHLRRDGAGDGARRDHVPRHGRPQAPGLRTPTAAVRALVTHLGGSFAAVLAGVHLLGVAVVVLTCVALHGIAREMLAPRLALAPPLLYAFASAASVPPDSLAVNGELLMNLPTALAVCAVLRASRGRRARRASARRRSQAAPCGSRGALQVPGGVRRPLAPVRAAGRADARGSRCHRPWLAIAADDARRRRRHPVHVAPASSSHERAARSWTPSRGHLRSTPTTSPRGPTSGRPRRASACSSSASCCRARSSTGRRSSARGAFCAGARRRARPPRRPRGARLSWCGRSRRSGRSRSGAASSATTSSSSISPLRCSPPGRSCRSGSGGRGVTTASLAVPASSSSSSRRFRRSSAGTCTPSTRTTGRSGGRSLRGRSPEDTSGSGETSRRSTSPPSACPACASPSATT